MTRQLKILSVQLKNTMCLSLVLVRNPKNSDINFKIVLVNNFRVGSFFHFKDVLPVVMRSSLVYSFRCALCASEYVGSTVCILHSGVAEHCGRSSRTGARLTEPPHSLMRNHAKEIGDFRILRTCTNILDL